jgi:hypothetical protein
MPYPVSVSLAPSLTNRNRLTTAFRLILAILHLILVGGIGFGAASGGNSRTTIGGEGGLLGAVAVFLAIVSWFTIVFAGSHIAGIRQFTSFYLRWRVRALAYFMLLEDVYPPFGDGRSGVDDDEPVGPRDRPAVGFRILLAVPTSVVLHPLPGASRRSRGFMAPSRPYPHARINLASSASWRILRRDQFLRPMVDEYPPFSLT